MSISSLELPTVSHAYACALLMKRLTADSLRHLTNLSISSIVRIQTGENVTCTNDRLHSNSLRYVIVTFKNDMKAPNASANSPTQQGWGNLVSVIEY